MNALTINLFDSSKVLIKLGGEPGLTFAASAIDTIGPLAADVVEAQRRTRRDVDGGFIITDNQTALEWSPDLGDATQAEAVGIAQACRVAGYEDWRLPTLDEQETNRDLERCNPACDPIFSDMQPVGYWTASSCAGNSDYAWFVYFNGGGAYFDGRDSRRRVRAVRSVARASQ